ncbi:DNA-directed RNA polymerase 1 polypeptide, partial [Danaus plexippus plexippus]
LLKRPQ